MLKSPVTGVFPPLLVLLLPPLFPLLFPVAGRTVASFVISSVRASSAKYLPHTSQCQYSILPASVFVGALASVWTMVCPVGLSIVSSFEISSVRASSEKYLPQDRQCQ